MKKKKNNKITFINKKKELAALLALLLFLLLTYTIFNNNITTIDSYIQSFILSIRNDNLTDIMITITNISSAYTLIVITILILVTIKNKRKGHLIAINLACSFILSQIAKIILHRPRPLNIALIETIGYSYPSGHSLISMTFFGFISYLIYKNLKSNFHKGILIIISGIAILLIGFSRIYLGVHYFSDVFGGFLLATAYLMIFIKLFKEKII